MPEHCRISQRLLADLEALREKSQRNTCETLRIIRAIEALKASLAETQSETSAVPTSAIKKPDEAA